MPWVSEATTATFAAEVIERSRKLPVLVDFWASWCAPCRTLGPTLEAAVEARGGDVHLVKVDVDANQELAARMGARSIPLVRAFVGARPAGEFLGARDRSFVDRFIAGICPAPDERALREATRLLREGAAEAALAALAPALASRTLREEALLVAARAQLALGALAEAERALAEIALDGPVGAQAAALAMRLELGRAAAGADEAALRGRLAAEPRDHDARFALAGLALERGQPEAALEHLLELLGRDRRYREDGARRAMLAIFELLGPDDPLSRDFRRRMQIVL